MRRFNVVIPKADGGVEVHRMKEWLRQHPDRIPPGLDATSSTAWQLRDGLKKMGWPVQTTDSEVRLIMPGTPDPGSAVTEVLGNDEPDEESQPETAFALEYQLRDFIAQNLGSIPVEGKKLRLFVDATGREGVEFPTAVGPIDILAVDDGGAFIVFELKRARSPDHAIGQVARYMGWVKQTIGKDQSIRGVIVAKTISDSLRYAVSVVPGLSLFEYDVAFQLRPVK